MNDNNRRYFSPEQKVAILREHLIEGKAVSDLCDKYKIHPTVFYQWQRQLFENGTAVFESKQFRSGVSDGYQKKIEAFGAKTPAQKRGALRAVQGWIRRGLIVSSTPSTRLSLTGLLQLAASSFRMIKYWSGFADDF